MRVDRKRFLVLTAAIGSGACGPELAPRPPVAVAEPAEASGSISVDVPEPSAPESLHGDGPVITDRPGDGQSTYGQPAPSRADSQAEPTHAPSALVARCQSLQAPPGPHCEGFHWTQTLCESFDRALHPAVARAAVQCLLGHSKRRSICRPRAREDCFTQALSAAPNLRQDRGRCATLVSHCSQGGHGDKSLTKTRCRRAVAAVRPAFRDEMLTCIAESCGLRQCVYVVEP